MVQLYNWLVCFAAVCLSSVIGDLCTDEDAVVKCDERFEVDDSQNLTGTAIHTEYCRKFKGYDECVKPFISNCTIIEQAIIVGNGRALGYLCGEALESYLKHYACLENTDISHDQCDADEELNRNSNRTEEEESTGYTEDECRALKQDLECNKQSIKTSCGEDAADVYDTFVKLLRHEHAKVHGCDIPDPFAGGDDDSTTLAQDETTAVSTSRVCCNAVSLLCLVISMVCVLIVRGPM